MLDFRCLEIRKLGTFIIFFSNKNNAIGTKNRTLLISLEKKNAWLWNLESSISEYDLG